MSPYFYLLNLDIFPLATSSLGEGGDNYQSYWYWIYAASFLGIAILVIVGSDVLRKYEYCLTDRKYITHIEETRATFEKLTYRLCRLSIIPCIQVTSRMFHCKASTDGTNVTSNVTTVASLVVRIDPTIQCYSYQHILRTFLILTPLCLAFLVYFLSHYDRIWHSKIDFHDERVHLKHLRSRKLEYILRLSKTFYSSGIYLVEHLQFHHIYHIIIWNVVKVIIIAPLAVVEFQNAREYNKEWTYSIAVWTFIVLLIHAVWCARKCGKLPYRSPSVNMLWGILYTSLLMTFCFTMLRHDAQSKQNNSVFTVDTLFSTVLQYTLWGSMLFGMLMSDVIRAIPPLSVFGYNSHYREQQLQGTDDTHGIKFDYGNQKGLNAPCRGCRNACIFLEPLPCACIRRRIYIPDATVNDWIQTVRDGQNLLYNAITCAKEMVPIHKIKRNADLLKQCLEQSKKYGHGYVGYGSDTGGHLLKLIIRETLEEMMCILVVYRRKSFLPNFDLEGENMAHVRHLLDRRQSNMILVDPRLKGVLNKLLAIRAWQSKSTIATKKGE